MNFHFCCIECSVAVERGGFEEREKKKGGIKVSNGKFYKQ